MRYWLAALAICPLGGCVTAQQEDPPVWVRTDGRTMTGDVALMQQFEIDRQVCLGEVQKSSVGAPIIYYQGIAGAIAAGIMDAQRANALADVARGCMAGKGYAQFPRSQAAEKAAEFRKTAQTRAKLPKS